MNKEVYNKNLKAYEDRYGKYDIILYNKYEKEIEDCKNGCKTIKMEIDNKKVYLNSKYDPIKEAERYYKDFEKINYGSVIFIFGFGFSYYITELYKKVESRATIVVYEKDKELFDIVMKNIDISHILKNKNIILTFNNNSLSYDIKNCDYKIEAIPVYKELYLEDYLEFMKDVKRLIKEARYNFNTLEYFKNVWARNTFANLKYILNSYNMSVFKDIFKNKPIVIVGAGPSLSKNIKLLKNLKGKVCIISVFSATRALKNEGIVPDFIATIDSEQYGLTEFEANIPLLYIQVANTELLEGHKGNKIVSISKGKFLDYILEDKIERDNIVPGGTVTYFATNCAKYFGASELILIGQDFSWTKEEIHVKGSVHKATEYYKKYHHYEMPVKDMYGNTVYTNSPFMRYKESFDYYAKSLPENVKLIQATEGGLSIEGAETRTLQECIDLYCKDKFCDVEEIISRNFKNKNIICDKPQEVYNKVRKVYDELCDIKKDLEESVELSKKLLKNIKYSTAGLKKNNNIIKRLDEIDDKIRKNDIIKELMTYYINDITEYFVIEEDEDEKINFAMMNEKLHIALKTSVENITIMIKEEMKYED